MAPTGKWTQVTSHAFIENKMAKELSKDDWKSTQKSNLK